MYPINTHLLCMGITIHYRGTLLAPGMAGALIAELRDIARSMHWPFSELDDDWEKPADAKMDYKGEGLTITGHLGLKGIDLQLHPDCESVPFFFNAHGRTQTFLSIPLVNEGRLRPDEVWTTVKTQSAPADIHITIIKLLRHIKKHYIPDLDVYDEGGFWETGSRQELEERRGTLTTAMDEIDGLLAGVPKGYYGDLSAEEMADLLELLLKKKPGADHPDG